MELPRERETEKEREIDLVMSPYLQVFDAGRFEDFLQRLQGFTDLLHLHTETNILYELRAGLYNGCLCSRQILVTSILISSIPLKTHWRRGSEVPSLHHLLQWVLKDAAQWPCMVKGAL